jgi:hypothetical protein
MVIVVVQYYYDVLVYVTIKKANDDPSSRATTNSHLWVHVVAEGLLPCTLLSLQIQRGTELQQPWMPIA